MTESQLMKKHIITEIKNWEMIFQLDRNFLSDFVFRGQGNSTWDLTTSIERNILKFNSHNSLKSYTNTERWMLLEFKRKAHLYSNYNIDYNNNFECLTILQHYGAPTRLLDFTNSFFIATYFAIADSNEDAAIWAINRKILSINFRQDYYNKYIQEKYGEDENNCTAIDFANEFLSPFPKNIKYPSIVIPLAPKLFNERLARQQGLFLIPINSDISFFDNLKSAFRIKKIEFKNLNIDELIDYSKERQFANDTQLIKIVIPKTLRVDIVRYLKDMNITSEILFPGLDGLARSLIHNKL